MKRFILLFIKDNNVELKGTYSTFNAAYHAMEEAVIDYHIDYLGMNKPEYEEAIREGDIEIAAYYAWSDEVADERINWQIIDVVF